MSGYGDFVRPSARRRTSNSFFSVERSRLSDEDISRDSSRDTSRDHFTEEWMIEHVSRPSARRSTSSFTSPDVRERLNDDDVSSREHTTERLTRSAETSPRQELWQGPQEESDVLDASRNLEAELRLLVARRSPTSADRDRPIERRLLIDDYFLPPNVEAAAFFFETDAARRRLRRVIEALYPSGVPLQHIFLIIDEPHRRSSEHVPNIIFAGLGTGPTHIIMSSFTSAALLRLIARHGFVPHINVNSLVFVHTQQDHTLVPVPATATAQPPTRRPHRERIVRVEIAQSTAQSARQQATRRILVQADLAGERSATCIICLEEKSVGDEITMLPCAHWFDVACIKTWLEEKSSSPSCRAVVDGL